MKIAAHMDAIAPFRVMQILERARALEALGHDVVHMEIGEPDFISPPAVIAAGEAALRAGKTHYTAASGLPELRAAIAGYYRSRFNLEIDAARILITPGASGALQLVLGILVASGDRVLLSDPGYPCNRHLVSLLGGEPVAVPVAAAADYAMAPAVLDGLLQPGARALMLASPANPTGNLSDLDTLRAINAQLYARTDAALIVDEIYQGLQYEGESQTALALAADNVFVINSFSKFFGMTGWRLGWVVAPEAAVEPMLRLAQNLYLAAPTLAQYAALVAFDDDNLAVLEERRRIFASRRDFLFDAIRELGFGVARRPAGAFYLYAAIDRFADDSLAFSRELLEQAAVAITPGCDFGVHAAERHVRFAYTTDIGRLELGVERMYHFLRAGAG